jgi:hypothetical protein
LPLAVLLLLPQDLEDMFIQYGRIVEIRINRDRFTGRCKGYGFVAMSREEEVDEVRMRWSCVARARRVVGGGQGMTQLGLNGVLRRARHATRGMVVWL